jgi:uncharacterized protein YukE
MAKVIADPEELKKFANYLKIRSYELQDKIRGIEYEFNNLSENWKDPVHDKFKSELLESLRALKQFVNVSIETSQYLILKAEILERYLDLK